ncbi:MAG: T9SS type A sorting domain-containing protein, partial [Bacteroidota bacterium]
GFLLVGLLFALPLESISQTYTQWQGTTTNWWTGTNWDNGVPNSTKNTRINKTNDDPYVPVPSSDTARTSDLEILSNGILRFASGGILVVQGALLKIQPNGKIFLGDGTIISRSNLQFFSNGSFYADSGTLEFSGVTWENKAGSTFDAGSSTVIFNGTGSQTLIINDTSSFSFNNLIITTSGTITINGSLTVTGDCSLATGSSINVASGGSFTVEGEFQGDPNSVGGAGNTSLPVQLTSFTVSSNRLDASLHWTTATELSNYGFEIERRRISQIPTDTHRFGSENDAVGSATSWSQIAFVQGSGTSSSPKEYFFVDKLTTPGRYAYRLRQVDFDGTFAYSFAAEAEVGIAPNELILGSNYPNPFNPTTNIEFTLPEPGRAVLQVFNMIGQHVATLFDGPADGGRIYQVAFSASSLPTGLYFYRLEYGNQSVVKRMMLVK